MGVHAHNTIMRPFYRIVLFIQPIVITTTVHMIYQNRTDAYFAQFVILGGGLAGIWSAMTFSTAGDVERARLQGVFSVLMAAPASLGFIFIAKIVMNALLSLLALVITVVYSWLVLGVQLSLPHPAAFGLALLGFLFGASGFALLLANLFLLTRTAWIFQNVLESPLFILGGVAFPITMLPAWRAGLAARCQFAGGAKRSMRHWRPRPSISNTGKRWNGHSLRVSYTLRWLNCCFATLSIVCASAAIWRRHERIYAERRPA